jgi:hypothetical protein
MAREVLLSWEQKNKLSSACRAYAHGRCQAIKILKHGGPCECGCHE